MIESLQIKNFKNLKEIKINSLGLVNLITGKNNTGKSTILEAVAIYASRGDLGPIFQILSERGENVKAENNQKNITEYNLRAWSSFFTDRQVSFNPSDFISIGKIDNSLFENSNDSISLRFVKYFEEIQKDDQGIVNTRRRILLASDSVEQFTAFKVGLEIRVANGSYLLPLDEVTRRTRFGFKGLGPSVNFEFIRTRNIDRETNGKLFDNIALTEKEQLVIDALKIIEPATERIAFIEEDYRERNAVIKLSTSQGVLPLRGMGDGINRILTIILALVNSDNGFLLIDEFENGLHHTVQEQLWEIIFKIAKQLNIQVFATTHSEDCISGFENILNNPENSLNGKFIRLENENGTVRQVEFSANELRIAHNLNIETR